MKFILWDPRDGEPRRDDDGSFLSDGILGRISAGNAYLTACADYPDERRPSDLEVGACIRGVGYSLSGSKGRYDVYRVE